MSELTDQHMNATDIDDAIETCIDGWLHGLRPLINEMLSLCYSTDESIADIVAVRDMDALFESTVACEEYIVDVCPLQAWGDIPQSNATVSFDSTTEHGRSTWCDRLSTVSIQCDAHYRMAATTTPLININATVGVTYQRDGAMSLDKQPIITVTEQ